MGDFCGGGLLEAVRPLRPRNGRKVSFDVGAVSQAAQWTKGF